VSSILPSQRRVDETGAPLRAGRINVSNTAQWQCAGWQGGNCLWSFLTCEEAGLEGSFGLPPEFPVVVMHQEHVGRQDTKG
jgi:hypothetical protein